MRRQNRRMVWGAAAVVAGLAVAACARDASAPGVGVPAEARASTAALSDGAVVRAEVRDEIELPRIGASAAVRDLGFERHEGVVVGGVALDGASGAMLALGPGQESGHRDLRHEDDEGHNHRLVLDGPSDGKGPPASVRYERDGELVAEIDYKWERRDGGYVVRERALTLHRHGRVLLRQVRRFADVEIIAGVPTAEAPGAGPAAPPLVWRTQMVSCFKEWVVYIGASAVLIVAGEVYTVAPNPASAGALIAAAGVWERALTGLLNCQYNSTIGL